MGHNPSGLFPAARSVHPTYREPHPVTSGGIAAGASITSVWYICFGLLATDLRSYAWWTLIAGLVAWAAAQTLVRFGDRGVAVGVAITTAGGWSIAAFVAAAHWIGSGDWPLW